MKYLLCIFFAVTMNFVYSEITVIYRGPENGNDHRMDYPVALIRTALDITIPEYGPYKLLPSDRMNSKRSQMPLVVDSIENFILEASVSQENENNLLSIKVPTTKGLFGYRVFLIDESNQYKFDFVKSIEDLKDIRIGQGSTWLDTKILEDSGLNIIKGLTYEGLLKMLMNGRFEAFPRGVNEAFKETEIRSLEYDNLTVEKNICLYYPLPKFLYTSKKSVVLNQRITKGLLMMVEDGSFDKIWNEYNYDYILKADLNNRRIIRLENKFLSSVVPLDDPRFWYNP